MQASPDIIRELSAREPIFHRPAFARTVEEFAALMADDYWEVGASGKVYDRAFILAHLAASPPVDAEAEDWRVSDFGVRSVGKDTFLATYQLAQGPRLSRRATLWQHAEGEWKILYHQGTLIGDPRA